MRSQIIFQYREGTSLLHGLDPFTKLVGMFAFTFLAFGTFIGWAQALITASVFLIAVVGGRISLLDIVRGTWFFGIACLGFLVVQGITLPGTEPGPQIFGHTIYLDSVDYALAIALRIYTIFLISLIFLRTTNPRDLAVAVVNVLRVPYRIAYAFFIALRIIPLIEEEMKVVRAAQRVRGVGERKGLRGRLFEARRYTMPLLIGSMREASTMVLSMEARGFGAYPTRTFVDPVPVRLAGKIVTAAVIALVVVWYTLIAAGVIHTAFVRSAGLTPTNFGLSHQEQPPVPCSGC
jgi:energy-coupling factor transport system permease protein